MNAIQHNCCLSPKHCRDITPNCKGNPVPAPLAGPLVAPKPKLDPATCWPFAGVEAA